MIEKWTGWLSFKKKTIQKTRISCLLRHKTLGFTQNLDSLRKFDYCQGSTYSTGYCAVVTDGHLLISHDVTFSINLWDLT